MKLNAFIKKPVSEEAAKAKQLGRLLRSFPEQPVVEAKKPVKAQTRKVDDEPEDQEAIRDFAMAQLEKTHPHIHKKSKHYD